MMPLQLVGALLLLGLSLFTDAYYYGVLKGGIRSLTPGGGLFFVATVAAIVGILGRQDWTRKFVMFFATFFMLGAVFWASVAAKSGPPSSHDGGHLWLLYTLILGDAVSAFYLPWCMGHADVAPWFDEQRR
jgi:hypothetical protein